MPELTGLPARKTVARIAGAFYLAFLLASILADQLGHIGISSADSLYTAMTLSPAMFRPGLVTALVSAFMFFMAAWCLYLLLRPVNRDLALLFLLLNGIGVAIQCASLLPLIFGMLVHDGSGLLAAFSPEQVKGLTYAAVNLYRVAFVTAQLFYGTWLFPLGYLVYKSRFLPRFLGILLIVDGFGVLFWFLQALLLPASPALSYPGLAISAIAEFGLTLWLLIMGAKDGGSETATVAGD